MSRTTDILISVGCLDNERADEFNVALVAGGFETSHNTPLLTSMHEALTALPGSKYYTSGLFAACWNFGYQKDVLINVFKAFDWDERENAILIISEEQDDVEVYRP